MNLKFYLTLFFIIALFIYLYVSVAFTGNTPITTMNVSLLIIIFGLIGYGKYLYNKQIKV